MVWRQVLTGTAVWLAAVASNQAIVHAASGAMPTPRVTTVTYPNGRVVERLAISVGRDVGWSPAVGPQPPFLEWLSAVIEPRAMTALATVTKSPQANARGLNRCCDPAIMGNWAAALDPNLLMQWVGNGRNVDFAPAVFNRFATPKPAATLAPMTADAAAWRMWRALPPSPGNLTPAPRGSWRY